MPSCDFPDPDYGRMLHQQVAGSTPPSDFPSLRARLTRSPRTLPFAVVLVGLASVACVGAVVWGQSWVVDRVEASGVEAHLEPTDQVPLGTKSLSVYLEAEQRSFVPGGLGKNLPQSVGTYQADERWAFGVTVQSALSHAEAQRRGLFDTLQEALWDDRALARLGQGAWASRFISVTYRSPSQGTIRVDVYGLPGEATRVAEGGEELVVDGKMAFWCDTVVAREPGNDGTRTTEELRPFPQRVVLLAFPEENIVFSPDPRDRARDQAVDFAREFFALQE